ncbi:MAG: 1-deoxy-D-xylulose-5-phosphate synthase, partial [Selenomonadaceae bacterium]|nr:1-deoxy-D-xylulose-5-phosphate synthase [Selenomonadaceae bacterium]
GVFDLSYLRQMPNMTVLVPKDEAELRQMLAFAIRQDGPVALRYPRGAGLGADMSGELAGIVRGRAQILREEGDIGMLAVGTMVDAASRAADILRRESMEAAVANMRFVKPLDEELLCRWAKQKKLLVTLEENVLAGGFGSAVLEFLADHGFSVPVLRIGIGDSFVEQGTRQELLELCGMAADQIAARVKARHLELDEVMG